MKYLLISGLSILFLSCATITVDYDYDRQSDFVKYKTYNYYQDIETGLSELDTKRLLGKLDEQLLIKGFKKSDAPDFFINISSTEYQNNQRNTVGVGLGGGGRNIGGGVSVGIPIGQTKLTREIIFDFRDENGNGLFWQAICSSRFNPNAMPDRRAEDFELMVRKVLEGYPPKLNK